MGEDDRVAAAKAEVMKLLGLTEEEVSYITAEVLDELTADIASSDVGDLSEEPSETDLSDIDATASVVPNRIWYMSEFIPAGFNPARNTNVYFVVLNCDRSRPYYPLFWDQVARYLRDGYCGSVGRYVPRYKVWLRV
jgi:hypothetical protein